MDAKLLEKWKRKLKKKMKLREVSASVNNAFEVYMWCAAVNQPTRLSDRCCGRDSAIHLAYESKLIDPTDDDLSVSVGIHGRGVAFLGGETETVWQKIFRGIAVRAVDYGDLPDENWSSRVLLASEHVRDFEIVGQICFGEHHFEPLRLTLEASA